MAGSFTDIRCAASTRNATCAASGSTLVTAFEARSDLGGIAASIGHMCSNLL